MGYDPESHHRRSTRLDGYDYSSNGAYFLTICVERRACLFGEVVNGEMHPNPAGIMIQAEWNALATRFAEVVLDQFIVMPNHIYGILGIAVDETLTRRGEPRVRPTSQTGCGSEGEHEVRPYGTFAGTLGRIVQAFKSITTNAYIAGVKQFDWPRFEGRLWQRNYYDHIIRSDHALDAIREYLFTNPQRWLQDAENPDGTGDDKLEAFIRSLDLRNGRGEPRVRPAPAPGKGEHKVCPYDLGPEDSR